MGMIDETTHEKSVSRLVVLSRSVGGGLSSLSRKDKDDIYTIDYSWRYDSLEVYVE